MLHVWAPGKTGLQQVRREVAAAYTARGLKKVRWQSTDRLLETLGGGIESLRRNEEPALDEDELLVFPEAAAGWIAVKSSRFEWTLPGHHPLALALSAKWDVLGVTSVAGQYVEYTLYRGGRPAEMTLVGTPPTPVESLPPLSLTWFGDKGALATPDALEASLADPEELSRLAGPDELGFRESFEAAPLEDQPKGAFLVFRRPDSPGGSRHRRHQARALYDKALKLWQAGKKDAAIAAGDALLALEAGSEWERVDLAQTQAFTREVVHLWRQQRAAELDREALAEGNTAGRSPVDLYNAAVTLAQADEVNETNLRRALALFEQAAGQGFGPAEKLARQLRAHLDGGR